MPLIAFLLIIGITVLSHLLRGECIALPTNIGISNLAFWCIVGLVCTRFGFGSDFWSDLFLAVGYSICGTLELIGLLLALYELTSPFLREDEEALREKWGTMEPRG